MNEAIREKTKALVVLSGGQDSTTCLAWAKQKFDEVHAVTFDYGQRHSIEITSASRIAKLLGAETFEIIKVPAGILKGTSPLVSDSNLEEYKDAQSLPGGVEKTFVPMRNQFFLTVAANRAFLLGCTNLVTGVCEADYGGYPDCRQTFISTLQTAMNQGTFTGEDWLLGNIHIHTPLMRLSKADSVKLAVEVGAMHALAFSHTAYDGKYPPTGKDHASLLRAKGFEEAGYPDPLVVRAKLEGLMEYPETPNYSEEELALFFDHIEQSVGGGHWYQWPVVSAFLEEEY